MGFLDGYKTYIVSGFMIAIGLSQLLGLDIGGVEVTTDPITLIMEGLGLGALRRGVATSQA